MPFRMMSCTYRFDDKFERNTMRFRRLLIKVKSIDGAILIICSLLLFRDKFRIQRRIVRYTSEDRFGIQFLEDFALLRLVDPER